MNQISPIASSDADHAARWLAGFEAALAAGDAKALAGIFAEECHWRDLLAFTWNLTPHGGAAEIAAALLRTQAKTQAAGFTLDAARTPPRRVKRLGIEVIEAIFRFETATGRGHGVLRLLADQPGRAWVLSTSLEALKGHEEPLNARRPSGEAYSRNFGGENWQDQRDAATAFAERDPTVVVIGAGQAGLAIAARLGLLGVDTLVVEKNARIGDNWRHRYHSLALHNQIHVNHLPYMPYPPHWPKYIPKDMLGGWFEAYAWAMQCNVWTSTEFVAGEWDAAAGHWIVRLRRADGSERGMRPRHIVFANGVSGIPKTPALPGIADFRGEVLHSHGFRSGAAWRGKRALVLGTGNSGHDVAQDLHSHGVATSIIQRGATTVVSIDPSAKLNYALYEEGPPLEDCDLLASAGTYPLIVRGYQQAVKRMAEFDKDLIAALWAKGFKQDLGADGTGHQMKYRTRGGGYYLNAGCSDLIISGEIGLLQWDDIERFVADGALMKDGRVERADLLVTATGYHTQQELVRRLLGEAIAERIGPVWGIGADGELNNMFRPTAQQGLWFMAGSLAQCRIYSQHLALQIKARELGVVA